MSQSARMLDKFRLHNNVLTTSDFAHDPMLACEYRRILCDMDKKGYTILRHKETPKL
jgi:hypothetical protein